MNTKHYREQLDRNSHFKLPQDRRTLPCPWRQMHGGLRCSSIAFPPPSLFALGRNRTGLKLYASHPKQGAHGLRAVHPVEASCKALMSDLSPRHGATYTRTVLLRR